MRFQQYVAIQLINAFAMNQKYKEVQDRLAVYERSKLMVNAIFMELNHDNAMALWKKQFGNAQKAKDFAGREMAKAAYGDENSSFGWNLDHILPQSQGGKNSESNLVCCSIQTNFEKADSFPCFSANGKLFEIVKVQNHFEPREIKKGSGKEEQRKAEESVKDVDFFDAAQGIRFYSHRQKKKHYNGMIHIYLERVKNYSLLDFVSEMFKKYHILIYETFNRRSGDESIDYDISIMVSNLTTRKDAQEVLNLCINLNTWLGDYFVPKEQVADYLIVFSMYKDQYEVKDLWNQRYGRLAGRQNLVINSLVKENTDADKENLSICASFSENEYYSYDYRWTDLQQDLMKRI